MAADPNSNAAFGWERVRSGVYRRGEVEIRRFSRWWAIVGEPYTLYLTLRDAKQEVENRG